MPVIAINAQGQVTSASNSSISIAGSQITSGTVAIANGGTGATSAPTALTNLGAYPASNPSGFTSNTGTVTSVNLTAGTGVSVSGGPVTTSGSITVTNTAPDQVVALTGAGATTVTGTYPNFTISSPASGAGTVTSIDVSGGTTGLTTSGGPVTSSGTITLAGTLNVANGGTGATTLTSGYLLKGNGTSAVSASVVYDTGTNVGIGTTSPGARLETYQSSGGTNAIRLNTNFVGGNYVDFNPSISGVSNGGFSIALNGTICQVISVSGNVGVGTTAPVSKFHVSVNAGTLPAASSAEQILTVSGADGASTRVLIDAFGGNPGIHTRRANGTAAAPTAVLTGNYLGFLSSWGYGTTAYAPGSQVRIGLLASENWTDTARGTYMVFDTTADGSTSIVERMRINNAGNVGINTTTPVGRLSVVSGSSTGASTSAWSGNYSVFGPNAGGATGAAIALGYNTSADAAEILALAPAVAWKPLNLYSAGLNLYASSGAIGASLNGSGTFSAATDVRAPVFYDSADTAFYVDPASGSRLGGVVQFNGGSKVEGNGDVYARRSGGSDGVYYFVDGGTKYLYWDGGQYLFGNAGVVTSTSFRSSTDTRAPIFYDSDNTSYYVDPASGSNLNGTLVNSGGTVMTAGWNRNMMLASTFPVLVFNSANTKYAGIGVDYTTASAALRFWVNASSSDVVTGTNAMNINSGGYVEAGGSFRAPIFYDLDNTAYYLDAAGTSVVNTVQYGINYTSGGGGGRIIPSTGSPYSLRQEFGSDNTGWRYGIAKNVSGTVTVQFFVSDSGIAEAVGDMRAPIFYDSNNTAYYIDPASTSVVNIVSVVGGIGATTGGAGNDPYGKIAVTGATDANYAYYGLTRAGQFGMGMGIDTSNIFWVGATSGGYAATRTSVYFQTNTSGDVTASSSFRAPLFYDSNNTGYYLNPAEISVMWRMGANYFQSNDAVSTDTPFGLYFDSALSSAYAIFREGGAWTHPYPDLRIAFHTGIKMGAAAGYGGMKFYTDYDMSSQVMSINNSADALGGGNVYVNNSLQAGSSLRAPIFYDSDNTGFYINPASNATLANIDVASVIDSAAYYDAAIEIRERGFGGALTTALSNAPRLGFHWGGRVAMQLVLDSGGTFNVMNGDTTAYSAFRASQFFGDVFYENSNNAFYLDPASTGTSLNVAGSIVAAGNVTAYSDIRVKANVEMIPSALDKLDQIRGVTYTRTDLADKERRYAGVIAQEIEQVLPEAVRDLGNIKAVDYNATIALLIQAVKELTNKVKALEAKEQ